LPELAEQRGNSSLACRPAQVNKKPVFSRRPLALPCARPNHPAAGDWRFPSRYLALTSAITIRTTIPTTGTMTATLRQGLDSVNLQMLQPERSDVCAVPAASAVAENVVAFEVARAWLDKFGADTLREVRAAYEFYAAAVRALA
jgi:chorismate synthase